MGVPTKAAPQAGKAAADARRQNIEAIFPLRPLQKALLLHAAPASGPNAAADPGLLQVQCRLRGDLSASVLRDAWEQVILRHAALRMSVHAPPGQQAMLPVWRKVAAPWAFLDWRGCAEEELAERMAAFLAEDRAAGLELASPPVMRMLLIRTGDDRYRLVWTCHHLFLDGWSSAVVIKDLLSAYGGIRANGHASLQPLTCTYRDYMAWFKARNREAARAHWHELLEGVRRAPPLRLQLRGTEVAVSAPSDGPVCATIERAESQALHAACQAGRITPNALIQGAWTVLLSLFQPGQDPIFGVTVSGRAADIDGIASLVGFFSNVVPKRIRIEPDAAVSSWLRAIRDAQLAAQPFETTDPADIQAWSGLPGNSPLFESLVVVENFPWHHTAPRDEQNQDLALEEFRSGMSSRYPLTLAVVPSGSWELRCEFDRGRFAATAIEALLGLLPTVMRAMVAEPHTPLALLIEELRRNVAETFLLETEHPSAARTPSAETTQSDPETGHRPPRNALELQLARLWEETLGVHPIGVGDDFFALGGTSIAAVRLFTLLEERLARKLPVTMLLEHPTLEALAAALDDHRPSPWKSLVPIQAGGSRPPLFCVHAGGAHVLFYRELATHFGNEQPVFGLQPVGLDGSEPPLKSIEQMAVHYVAELRSVQPEGPYRLAGYCIGATICLEMARELERQGQIVDLLAVLDSGLDQKPGAVVDRAARIARSGGLFYLATKVARQIYAKTVSGVQRGRVLLRRRWMLHFGDPARRRDTWLELMQDSCDRAFRAYMPRPCKAPILLIRSSEYAAMDGKNFHFKWAEMTQHFSVDVVHGIHDDLLNEPYVGEVARSIQARIDADASG